MKSAGVSVHGMKNRNRHKEFAVTVEIFLQNVHHARISNEPRLQFATGAKHYPDTMKGLFKKAVRQIKKNG